ncbi:MAG: hypothetical protein LDL53_11595, partial [Candidatus Hydrogenedens sp.]|nr:hypothetical protein [Candidatus Hydrogenedens sp.]
GRGHIKSVTTMLLDILRRLKSLFVVNKEKKVILQTHPHIAKRLREENMSILESIQKEFNRDVIIESVSDFHIGDYRILSARTRLILDNQIHHD